MNEGKFKYEVGGVKKLVGPFVDALGVEDYRAGVVDELQLPTLDQEYWEQYQLWVELRAMLNETLKDLDSVLEKRGLVEARLRIDTSPEKYRAGSAPERKALLTALVHNDPDWQVENVQVLQAQDAKRVLEIDIADAEKALSVMANRISWRARFVGFMSSVSPIDTEKLAL